MDKPSLNSFTCFVAKELFSIIAVVILFGIFLSNLFDGSRSFAQFQDNTYMILPIFSHISKAFASGEFPYWMNSVMGGIPLYDAAQFSPLYPFYFFHFNLFQDPLSSIVQVHYIILFHALLIAVNTYILSRIIGLNRIISIFVGLLFCLSPNTLSYMYWVNAAPLSWFPLAIGAFILILDRTYRKTGISLGVFSISMLVLASASQVFIQLIYLCLILFILKVYRLRKKGQSCEIILISKDLFLMSVISILIVSPVLVPTTLHMAKMIRWIGDAPPLIGNDKIPFGNFLLGQLSLNDLANVLLPIKSQHLIGSPFLGIPVLFFALLAVFYRKRSRTILVLFFIGALGLCASAGQHLGLAYLLYYLPLLNKLREPARHLLYFIFCFSLLAGLGIQYITEELISGECHYVRNYLKKLFFVFFTAVLAIVLLNRIEMKDHYEFTFLSFVVVLLLLILLSMLKRYKILFTIAICSIILTFNYLQYPWDPPKITDGDYVLKNNLVSHEVLKEISTIPDITSYRVLFSDSLPAQWWSMNASYYNIRTLNAYFNPLPYEQFTELYDHGLAYDAYLSTLGAKYLLCNSCKIASNTYFKFVKKINGISLFKNEFASPYVFISNKIGNDFQDMREFKLLVNSEVQPSEILHFKNSSEATIAQWIGSSAIENRSTVIVSKKTVNTVAINAFSQAKAVLVLNEYYTPDWKVEVNGVPSKIIRVNLSQIGVKIDAGQSLVVFKYHPTLFIYLVYLSGVMIILSIFYLMFFQLWSGVKHLSVRGYRLVI